MFEQVIGDVTYTFNCKLGTTVKIKAKFNKPFNEVVKTLGTYDIPKLIEMLYCAYIGEQSYKEFEDFMYENLGMMELYDLVQLLVKKIQYPNLTEEEIDLKLEEKNEKAEAQKK